MAATGGKTSSFELNEESSDGGIQVVETARGTQYPLRATESGLPELDDAIDAARQRAIHECRWADGEHAAPESTAASFDQCRLAVAARPERVVGHVRGHDGIDVIVQGAALDQASHDRVMTEGGGLLLNLADDASPIVNSMCGQLSVAWQARVGAIGLFGSETTRVLGPQAVRTCVVPVSEAVIVHPDGGDPFDVAVGSATTVPGVPRVLATRSAFTLLFIEQEFTPQIRKQVLEARARFHPLLRLDSPVETVEPVDVYGVDEPVSYLELLRGQMELLVRDSPDDMLRWWWLLDHRFPPFPHRGGDLTVRGRFPGGIGVVARDEVTLVRGAGWNLQVPPGSEDFLVAVAGGAPVHCDEASGRLRVAERLLACGIVESL